MATVTGPDGSTFEETGAEALAYYSREPGFAVGGAADPVEVLAGEQVEVGGEVPERPADSASKKDWYDYATKVAADVPAYDDITQTELVDTYGK